jgi:hypothetical protein
MVKRRRVETTGKKAHGEVNFYIVEFLFFSNFIARRYYS